MNRLYFVRHAEGQDNVARQYSCKRVDHPLSERGVLQAEQTGEYLTNKSIDEVYSSPMKRAAQTAQIIAARLGKEVTVLENFRELDVGELEGQFFNAENWAFYLHITNEWLAGNREIAFPGGENHVVLWERWRSGLLQILAGKTDRNILLVAHAGIFTATLKDLCPDVDMNWLMNAGCYNCSITELEIEVPDGQPRGKLIAWSSHEHLSGEVLSLLPGIPPVKSVQNSEP
jgi:probable phosphoglycerate mutase